MSNIKNKLSSEEIRATLLRWNAAMQECDQKMDALSAIAGVIVESPLGNAVYGLMGAFTREVARAIDWDESTLEDWWTSHSFGEKQMCIGFTGEPMRDISTIEQLAQFVIDDIARGEK